MHLCLVEDTFTRQFLPLTHFHPVYDLRCGIFTLQERIIRYLRPAGLSLHCRSYLIPLTAEEHTGATVGTIPARRCLVLNGRCVLTPPLARLLKKAEPGCVYMSGEEFVAAVLEGQALESFREAMRADLIDPSAFHRYERRDVEAELLRYPWDCIAANDRVLEADMALLPRSRSSRTRRGVHRSAVLVGGRSIVLGTGCVIGPGAVLDAGNGPIHIGHRAVIHPLAVIEGPASIGDGAVVNAGARIGSGTVIGPVCKVGGEVHHSIMHSYANKQHDGFLGHSYLAPWVNLGAGTTTSNLKNTYGNITVQSGRHRIDTGRMFLGLIAGDHLRTGINVPLDTGTIAGVSCNIFGAALPPKFIPSFSWGEAGDLTTYQPDKALDVATRAMSRRGIQCSEAYARVFHHVYNETAYERTGARG
jgi:UDP-N-acetylglucosamine diphosphorylase / glucose-1-phosphate thymidylyltransferase / UDP-N-acetylgalactosamine diphosphorylase / glucosamine-1-phosphate N-acetyltransferase / galactosamine-1-phosphate N-acetyltransferase